MELAFPLQTTELKVSWTPAQATVLLFLTGHRPSVVEFDVDVNGVKFSDSVVEVRYFWDRPK